MKRKTIIILSVIVLIIAAVVIILEARSRQPEYSWKTSPVVKGKIIILVKATGTIQADTTVDVGTQVSGIIWKLYADFNSVVRQGQIIAVLDTTFLSATRIDAEATLEKAQAQLDQAQRDYDRNRKLLEEKVVAQADFETFMTNLAVAKSAVTSAKAGLNHALINLQYAVIRAPVNGVVISRNVELGQTVAASFNTPTLFSIANDLTRMQVQASVDEADIGQVAKGQKVTFTVDAYPDEVFNGTISQVRLQPVIVQNVVNYVVIINVPNPDLKLKPGLTANISINVQEHDNILKVPANATTFNPPADYIAKSRAIPDSVMIGLRKFSAQTMDENTGGYVIPKTAYVWIKKDSYILPVKVHLGLSDGNFTEVKGDIAEGDEVVTGLASGASYNQSSRSPFMPQFPGRK